MKKRKWLIPVLIILISCSNIPTNADALQKLNMAANPTNKSLFKFSDLTILKKTESKRNDRRCYFIDYSAIRKANKDLIERINAVGQREYIDPPIQKENNNYNGNVRSVKKGQIIDTLFASMILVKGVHGWE
ncbi:hypothetical protein SAMN05444410_10830 [Hydrobacter penzbergensis]|uniref:Uncharacterized protein n=1 Tax=Hydrobacter penzbergensis TaxID=1235997 RepID=A0A8X8LDW2_9BACT|nr:hypothetical protein [Hydrobacter penzbergensis]SDX01173.1 hypothetical protein SAMN05444410_10830 [Hydrobacter penzbergensis]